MISMMTPILNALAGGTRAAAPIGPGIAQSEPYGSDGERHECEHRHRAEKGQKEHHEADGERSRQRARGHEPAEHPETAHGVQRAKKDEEIATDSGERRERRQQDDRQPSDQAPNELVVETKFPQATEREAQPSAPQAMISRPTQRESHVRLERE